MNTEKNCKIAITDCVFGGDGIGRDEAGQVVFVPGALPGETVDVVLTAERKNFRRAVLAKPPDIPSPHRIAPECPLASRCPGCAYLHCDFAWETELKQRQFLDFVHGAHCDTSVCTAPLAPPERLGYRNKLELHVAKDGNPITIGYLRADGRTIEPLEQCLLARTAINEFLAQKLRSKSFAHTLRDGMNLIFRYTDHDGVLFYRNRPSPHQSWLRETVPTGELSVPADGFFQVNSWGAATLQNELTKQIAQLAPHRVLDLYCGTGLFLAAAAATGITALEGVELGDAVVAAANYNLRNISTAHVHAADAETWFARHGATHSDAQTLLIADPPRGGLPPDFANFLNRTPIPDFAYVSCHPATWARDAGRLNDAGWQLRRGTLINQFPGTAHFEIFSCWHRSAARPYSA